MADSKEIGEVEKSTYKETRIEWKIPDLFSVLEGNYKWLSPAFTFASASWRLQMVPKSKSNSNNLCLFLLTQVLREYTVEYNFGLKTLDGSVKQLDLKNVDVNVNDYEAILNFVKDRKGNQTFSIRYGIIRLWRILEYERELSTFAPSGVLTIVCTMKREATRPSVFYKADLDTLSGDFRNLFLSKRNCDTTLRVKDKEYKVHKVVLIARSAVFAAMFQYDTTENQTGIIAIPDCEPEPFQHFLEYMYCGKLEGVSTHTAIHLYNTSDKYGVQTLKAICVENLMQCITAENICDIIVFADRYDEAELFAAAQDFFNRNLKQILETSEWECFNKDNSRLADKLLKKMSLKRKFIDSSPKL